MALNTCTSCTTKFAVGLPRCPHCRSTEYVEDGDPMAKITRNGGVTDDAAPAVEEDAAAAESDPAAAAAADQPEADVSEQREDPGTVEPAQAAGAGEDQVWPGPADADPAEGATAEAVPEESFEKPVPDETGTATQRRSRRRNQTAE
jgi:hypothetical protein